MNLKQLNVTVTNALKHQSCASQPCKLQRTEPPQYEIKHHFNMFSFPVASSSPPSTPSARSKQQQSSNIFRPSQTQDFFIASNVSNTPSGPPPSMFNLPSTTPAGPPPSSVFGSVNYNSSIPFPVSKFGKNSRNSPLRQAVVHAIPDDDDAMDEDLDDSMFQSQADQPMQSVEGLNIPAIAKAVARQNTSLSESNDTILGSEHVIDNLHAFVRANKSTGDALDLALATAVREATGVWELEEEDSNQHQRIGPGDDVSGLTKGLFLTSLLLPLHHPSLRTSNQHGMFKKSSTSDQPKSIPQVLVEWLKQYHTPYPTEVKETLDFQPNPCASDRYWDVILSSIVRGSLADALRLLKDADFRYAATALEEGAAEPGYRGKQLGNVQRVVNRAIAVLEACPANQSGDWNVSNSDWALFRKRINQATEDLAAFAEGPNHSQDDLDAENFGLSQGEDYSNSRISRRAESRIPFSVLESLQAFYQNLLGNGREIAAASADWVEASIGQTIWWDGEPEDVGNVNFASSRSRALTSGQESRPVDIMPRRAYRQKLSLSLRHVLSENEDAELQVNTTSDVEVGLACILEDDTAGVLSILQGWCMSLATSVVEIATLGSWLEEAIAPSQNLMDQFTETDLMVLSFAGNKQEQKKLSLHDSTLASYALLLSTQATLSSKRYNISLEGWELAIRVASRITDTIVSTQHITSFLDSLDLRPEPTSTTRIEKVMNLCQNLALPDLAQRTAERYAVYLTENTHDYGGALYYFARAHNLQRTRDVLNLLISSCLVRSIAYPMVDELDSTLQSILYTPKTTLAKLSLLDHEAADMLSTHFSGYAMLRTFYDLRDQEITAQATGLKPALRPIARKKAAASALIAAITSAGDSIHGGLFDHSVDSVIPVDGLAVLLGEALCFISRKYHYLFSSALLFSSSSIVH
jgi:hypothetical protein